MYKAIMILAQVLQAVLAVNKWLLFSSPDFAHLTNGMTSVAFMNIINRIVFHSVISRDASFRFQFAMRFVIDNII